MKAIRLKVKRDAYSWLNQAAVEVNQVFNWANETSANAADRDLRAKPKQLSGFDLNNLSAGASEHFTKISADTIQRVNCEYAQKRRAAKLPKLRWRVSHGPRKSLGWVPFKTAALKRKGSAFRFCSKTFRVFNREYLADHGIKDGCFAQDACGDWWLCAPISVEIAAPVAPCEAVGVDLGLKTAAVTSDGERLESGVYRRFEPRIAQAQRRGHKRQAKRLHRKAARVRLDAIHKFSTGLVRKYQTIVIGDVSSTKLVKTRMAKSVLDAGWGMLKAQLKYKGEHASRSVQVVNESYTTRACSSCGCLSGPSGLRQLDVRAWICGDCGASHDRDINAAKNILARAKLLVSVSGNERVSA